MEQGEKTFWTAVVAGVVVMILFGLFSVYILKFIPLLGPFIGGLVAGLVARKSAINGGKAGLFAGIISAVVVSIDMFLGIGYLHGSVEMLVAVGGALLMIVTIIYFAFLGFLGGAIGGALRP